MSYPQFGAIGVAPVRSKRFAKQKTGITVSATTGALKTYKVEGGSSAEGAASTVATALGSVQQSLLDIKVGQELELLKKQKELLDAKKALDSAPEQSAEDKKLAELRKQKELVDAELALAKAKKDLADLNKPTPTP
jgi:Skp family chaperone for outer membrane proteins